MPVAELAEIIERDPEIVDQTIKAANILENNPYAIEVTAVTQAIQLLGFNHVSRLTITLLLLRLATNDPEQAALREAASSSLVSCLLSRELARQRGSDLMEPCFASSLLLTAGRLLFAAGQEPSPGQKEKTDGPIVPDWAVERKFGVPSREVGALLFAGKHKPAESFTPIHFPRVGNSQKKLAHFNSRVQRIASLSLKLCSLIARNTLGASAFAKALRSLAAEEEATTGLNMSEMRRAVAATYDEMGELGARLQVEVEDLPLGRNLRHRFEGTNPPFARLGTRPKPSQPRRAPVVSGLSRELRAIFSRVVDGLQERFQFQDILAFVREEAPESIFQIAAGKGPIFEELPRAELIREQDHSLVSVALQHRKDIFLPDIRDTRTRDFLPRWMRKNEGAGSLMVLVFTSEDQPFGVVLGIQAPDKPPPSESDLSAIRSLREGVVQRFRQISNPQGDPRQLNTGKFAPDQTGGGEAPKDPLQPSRPPGKTFFRQIAIGG
jgi:hypothetical protein